MLMKLLSYFNFHYYITIKLFFFLRVRVIIIIIYCKNLFFYIYNNIFCFKLISFDKKNNFDIGRFLSNIIYVDF